MQGRFSFKGSHDEVVAVEYWDNANDPSVEQHTHEFWELIFVKSGIAEHTYRDANVILMANDVLLVEPRQYHSFDFSDKVEIYNCQFFDTALSREMTDVVASLSYTALSKKTMEYAGFRSESETSPASDPHNFILTDSSPLNLHGIIHLGYTQAMHLEDLLKSIAREKIQQLIRYHQMEKKLLEHLLIYLERIMSDQFSRDDTVPQKHKDVVTSVLSYIDIHFTETIDYDTLAIHHDLSPNYFRKVFKKYTGTTPVAHQNRVRILKAIDIMRVSDRQICDIAADVGIYDANYFSRMFKKYTGYAPSQFLDNHFSIRFHS